MASVTDSIGGGSGIAAGCAAEGEGALETDEDQLVVKLFNIV